MKKLSELLMLIALGLFAVGCAGETDDTTGAGPDDSGEVANDTTGADADEESGGADATGDDEEEATTDDTTSGE